MDTTMQGSSAPERRANRREWDPLTESRRRSEYTAAERAFSMVLHKRLEELLEGRRNSLQLLRRYPAEPGRLGVIPIPRELPRDGLRLGVVEALIWEAIAFVRSDGSCGPVGQSVARDGSLVETRLFSTRYPHVVIERVDRYASSEGTDGSQPLETTWSLRRVQNQRAQVNVNRVLDAVSVCVSLVSLVR